MAARGARAALPRFGRDHLITKAFRKLDRVLRLRRTGVARHARAGLASRTIGARSHSFEFLRLDVLDLLPFLPGLNKGRPADSAEAASVISEPGE